MRKSKALIFQTLIFLLFILLITLLPMKKIVDHSMLLITALFFITFFCILHIRKNRKNDTDIRKNKKQNTKNKNTEAEINGFYKDFIFENKTEAKKSYDEYRKQKMDGTLGEPQHSHQVISALLFLDITKTYSALTVEDIKKAYRKKAREIHPDLNNNSHSSKIQMQQLNAYYELLLKLKGNKK